MSHHNFNIQMILYIIWLLLICYVGITTYNTTSRGPKTFPYKIFKLNFDLFYRVIALSRCRVIALSRYRLVFYRVVALSRCRVVALSTCV